MKTKSSATKKADPSSGGKVPIEKTLGWGLRKFGRWFKIYRHIVEITEKEMGGKLHIFGEERHTRRGCQNPHE